MQDSSLFNVYLGETSLLTVCEGQTEADAAVKQVRSQQKQKKRRRKHKATTLTWQVWCRSLLDLPWRSNKLSRHLLVELIVLVASEAVVPIRRYVCVDSSSYEKEFVNVAYCWNKYTVWATL